MPLTARICTSSHCWAILAFIWNCVSALLFAPLKHLKLVTDCICLRSGAGQTVDFPNPKDRQTSLISATLWTSKPAGSSLLFVAGDHPDFPTKRKHIQQIALKIKATFASDGFNLLLMQANQLNLCTKLQLENVSCDVLFSSVQPCVQFFSSWRIFKVGLCNSGRQVWGWVLYSPHLYNVELINLGSAPLFLHSLTASILGKDHKYDNNAFISLDFLFWNLFDSCFPLTWWTHFGTETLLL